MMNKNNLSALCAHKATFYAIHVAKTLVYRTRKKKSSQVNRQKSSWMNEGYPLKLSGHEAPNNYNFVRWALAGPCDQNRSQPAGNREPENIYDCKRLNFRQRQGA